MASAESKLEDLVGLLEELRDRWSPWTRGIDAEWDEGDEALVERIDAQLADLNHQLRAWAGIDGPA